MLIGIFDKPKLVEDAFDVRLDGAIGDEDPVRDRAVRHSFSHQRQHLSLAVAKPVEPVVPPLARQKLGNDRRVDDGLLIAYSPQGVDQNCRVEDSLLDQVLSGHTRSRTTR